MSSDAGGSDFDRLLDQVRRARPDASQADYESLVDYARSIGDSAGGIDPRAMMARAAEQLEAVQAMSEQVAEVRGEAEAADGKVRVTVQQGGQLEGLELEPRAMRMQSHELAQAVLDAVSQASQDATNKVNELVRQAMPGAGPEVTALTEPADLGSAQESSQQKINEIIDSLRRGL